jgi:hypothetical protein
MLMKLQKDKGQRQIKSGFEILSPNVQQQQQQQQQLMDQGRVSREKQEEERKN